MNIFNSIAKRINKENIGASIVVGGHHATICPEDFNTYADAVCIGEGEDALLKYCKGEVGGGVWEPSSIIEDLDSIPFPKYDIDQIYLGCNPK